MFQTRIYQIFVLTLIVFTSAVFIRAQKNQNEPVEWMMAKGKGSRYSLEIPKTMTGQVRESENGKKVGTIFSARTDDTYFFIIDDIGSIQKSDSVKIIAKFLEQNDGSISANKQAYRVQDSDGFFHRILIRELPKNTLIFHTVSLSEDDPNVTRFFSKLTINSEQFVGFDKIETVDVVAKQETTEDATTQTNVLEQQGLPDRSFNVLSKPRPPYTDMARHYCLSGTVILKVTFGADGKVWNVVTIRKLPFGLTKTAIEAARKMTFRPKISNGKSVAVTRSVEYGFLIY